ncbi:MAG: hypothetical protein KF901_10910 [Myxococcales bacterium]|nr:hypothetical protein [Myxococcales bacterium]
MKKMKLWIGVAVFALGLGAGFASRSSQAGAQCKAAGQSCTSSAECCGICTFTNDNPVGRCEGG